MALSIDQFINEVAASGLVPAAELLTWLSVIPDSERPKSGEELARELVQKKKLTQFQAEQIYAGQGKSLTLGNYLILDKLGQGGMGLVLKAMHRRMERIVALKVMSQAGMRSPDAVQRFHREVKAAAKLNHPNIVTAYDADESNGTHFLVMEYVEGANLSALVKERGPLPAEQAVQYILQAARGLEYAHSRGVIHRDIKPSNLLLSRETRDESREGDAAPVSRLSALVSQPVIKILDMGLARIDGGADAQAELTTTGAVMGTVDYMSPEQALSAKFADARSDIYSLGISLWYLLTGRVAYDGDSMIAKVLAHRDAPIPSLVDQLRAESRVSRERAEAIAAPDSRLSALDSVFHRMVAKQPKDRYQSMTEVIVDLERYLASEWPAVTSSKANDWAAESGYDATSRGPFIGSSRTSVSQSALDAETMILSLESGKESHAPQSVTLERTGFEAPKVSGRTTKVRIAFFGSAAAVVIVLLAMLFSENAPRNTSGNSPPHVSISPPTTGNFAIEFAGGENQVEIDGLTVPDVGAFTWEGWVAPKSSENVSLMSLPVADGQGLFRVSIWKNGPEGVRVAAQKSAIGKTSSQSLPQNGPFHLAMTQNGDVWTLWVGGKQVGQGTNRFGWDNPVKRLFAAKMGVDWGVPIDSQQRREPFQGTLDEVRISKVARYKADFIPQTRLEPDKDTIALYHFDEGTGIELRDSSGNGHHGKVSGAQWVKVNDATGGLSAIGEVVIAPSPPWTDWLGPKLNKGDFAAQFDAREWVREGDAISTQGVISGIAVLPQGTRNGAIRLTYLLRDSKGIEIDARDGNTNGVRELYKAQDDGTQLSIIRFRKGSPYDYLAKQMVPASVPKDLPRTLEFRVVGDTLTATLNGSVVATANDATNTVSNGTFALVALKGVLIQKVEYQKLDEMAPKTAAISDRANAVGSPPSRAKAPLTTMQARTHQEVWAKHLGTTVETTNSVDAKMVLIPPGEFLMGSSDEQIEAIIKDAEELRAGQDTIGRIQKDERPQHRVVITKPFFLGATEVTIGQFKKFVAATGFQTHAESNSTDDTRRTYLRPGYSVTDDSPVSCVNWEEAVAYCRWLSDLEKATYRLPTEAEWEYACRAGTKTLWSWGDDRTLIEKYAWTIKDSEVRAHPVATKQPNPFRLFDMHGNLSEWCQDTFGEAWYAKSPLEDPFSTSGIHLNVVRGGNWDYHSITRSAYRMALTKEDFRYTVGFRIVREIELSKEQVSADRRAAEWVITHGGSVMVFGQENWIVNQDDLPSGHLRLIHVKLGRSLSGADADLVPLRELTNVVSVGMDESNVSSAGIAGLEQFPILEQVSLGGERLGDDRLAALARLKSLKHLSLYAAELTPEQSATLARTMPQLVSLNLQNNRLLDDRALEPFRNLSNLATLEINGTQVTAAGVAALQKSLPNCKIQWDGAGQ